MRKATLREATADGIIVHDDFLAHLIACPLVCQSAHFQDLAGHLETKDHARLREPAVLAAPQEHVASGQPAETHVHAYLSRQAVNLRG